MHCFKMFIYKTVKCNYKLSLCQVQENKRKHFLSIQVALPLKADCSRSVISQAVLPGMLPALGQNPFFLGLCICKEEPSSASHSLTCSTGLLTALTLGWCSSWPKKPGCSSCTAPFPLQLSSQCRQQSFTAADLTFHCVFFHIFVLYQVILLSNQWVGIWLRTVPWPHLCSLVMSSPTYPWGFTLPFVPIIKLAVIKWQASLQCLLLFLQSVVVLWNWRLWD